MDKLHIGLFNDSFPPTIDGVAQAVKNYAGVLHRNHCNVTVVTPGYKGVRDDYPFEVFRYSSIPLDRRIGYRAGNPFNPETLMKLRRKHFDLMHIHAPFASSVLVNNINHRPRVPTVLTYHTKFDIDIAKRVHLAGMRRLAMRFLLDNINAVDEVWVVTEGCGQALRKIGYKGGYTVMENGTDFAYGRAAETDVDTLREKHQIRDGEFVFLFVGRMMWYKNIRLILDSLALLREEGVPFRALLVGDGYDAPDIRAYAGSLGLQDRVVFTGAIYDRKILRVYYSLADLFLFPSTYDTSGIVVKEAAACDCPALLVRGSCAAEGEACGSRQELQMTGQNAGKSLYLSWDDAVDRAYKRYQEILKIWPGPLPYNSKNKWI